MPKDNDKKKLKSKTKQDNDVEELTVSSVVITSQTKKLFFKKSKPFLTLLVFVRLYLI